MSECKCEKCGTVMEKRYKNTVDAELFKVECEEMEDVLNNQWDSCGYLGNPWWCPECKIVRFTYDKKA